MRWPTSRRWSEIWLAEHVTSPRLRQRFWRVVAEIASLGLHVRQPRWRRVLCWLRWSTELVVAVAHSTSSETPLLCPGREPHRLGFLLVIEVGNRLLTPRPICQGVSDWLATVKPPQVRTFVANQTEKACAYVLDPRGTHEF